MIAFALGVLGWTLAEYLIHRFDGHGMRGKTPFSKEHLAHHRDPRTFAASWKKAVVACVAAAVLVPLTGVAFTAGFVAMYLTYEIVHRRIHTHAPIGAYGRWARRHHLIHHHHDPEMNHGVTSPLWDLVFGTWIGAAVVEVPRHRVPVWLQDESGSIHARFQTDYQLRGASGG